ncbi:tripartite motif-containing protein 16-like protein [Engraulis encrasicolus]|uniref:tripartite motif-containing protein 16-like protein n=1 Tax=Engraulis encrasicolus TaxID=184585 RepID=UPI002FD19F1E
MADVLLLREQDDSFFCPICLELLRDPVAIPCGHNYCMDCIRSYWDQDEQRGCYSCPQCRHTSPCRPVLNKNPLIAQLVDKVRTRITATTSSSSASAAVHNCHLPSHVRCEFCAGVKILPGEDDYAALPCLSAESVHVVCGGMVEDSGSAADASCCVPVVTRRGGRCEEMDAVKQLRDNICSHSEKLLEMFGHSHQHHQHQQQQQCLCYLCPAKRHTTRREVQSATRTPNKQRGLHEPQRQFQQRVQEREREAQELRRVVETLKHSAQAAVGECEGMFGGLLRSMERRAEEKAKLKQAQQLLRRMEEEIRDLRKEARLGPLSLAHTDTHLHQSSLQPECKALVGEGAPIIMVNQHTAFEELKQSVTELKERLDDFLITVQSVLPPEPQTRDEFLQYSRPLTLDPNTVHRELLLSEGNRTVTHCDEYQSYPARPERFDGWEQVLCREGAAGRSYWEVEWSGEEVSVAVSYSHIGRKGHGRECGLGSNEHSWSLDCSKAGYTFRHDSQETELPLVVGGGGGGVSNRIGVYVDHRAGTLAFYSISGAAMTLLHRVQTTFVHTLYPAFWLGFNFHHGPSSVKLL